LLPKRLRVEDLPVRATTTYSSCDINAILQRVAPLATIPATSSNKTNLAREPSVGRINEDAKSPLAFLIENSIQREIFLRIQKILILLKVLAESSEKQGMLRITTTSDVSSNFLKGEPSADLGTIRQGYHQAIQQVRTSAQRLFSIFSPVVFQLYPEQLDIMTSYLTKLTMVCSAEENPPVNLLSEIELPIVRKYLTDFTEKDQEAFRRNAIQESTIHTVVGIDERGSAQQYQNTAYSKEYLLYLASIYLSETLEQLERAFEEDVEKLLKLIRPEVFAIENACSKIHRVCVPNRAKSKKWTWKSEFKTY
jgi:hypothetical protein